MVVTDSRWSLGVSLLLANFAISLTLYLYA